MIMIYFLTRKILKFNNNIGAVHEHPWCPNYTTVVSLRDRRVDSLTSLSLKSLIIQPHKIHLKDRKTSLTPINLCIVCKDLFNIQNFLF
jgi:hypothetical protein